MTIDEVLSDTSSAGSAYFGPLTTAWTPPASCLEVISVRTTSGDVQNMWEYDFVLGYQAKSVAQSSDWGLSSCFPSYSASTTVDLVAWSIAPGNGYFSPGACPKSYTYGCMSISTSGPITLSEAVCCPTSYTCLDFLGGSTICRSTVTSAISSVWFAPNLLTFNHGFTSGKLSTITPGPKWDLNYIELNGIRVQWQESDLSILSSLIPDSHITAPNNLASATPALKGSSPAVTSATGASGLRSGNYGKESDLSTAAKAGIGTSVSMLIILLVLFGAFLLFRRRSRRGSRLSGYTFPLPGEMGDNEIKEMDAELLPGEFPEETVRFEMAADSEYAQQKRDEEDIGEELREVVMPRQRPRWEEVSEGDFEWMGSTNGVSSRDCENV